MTTHSSEEIPAQVRTGEYRAVVESYDDAPDQCTIYPTDTGPHERMSTWITASEPGFVVLDEHR